MKCIDPFVKAGRAYPCGRCLPCRSVQRRVWMSRIMLEASCHEYSSFCTLTYDDSSVPSDGSLKPEHLRDWLKRLRRRLDYPVRFYAVGEYGDQSGRPHYHVALFHHGCRSFPLWQGGCTCVGCSAVRGTWGHGHILMQPLVPASAMYLCGYVTKKLERTSDWLRGRAPEFARMSLKPGIGANAMWDVASVILQYSEDRMGIPSALLHGGRSLLIGRYLKKTLMHFLGRMDENLPLSAEYEKVLRMVQDYAFNHSVSHAAVYREINDPYASQLAQKHKERPL